MTSPPRKYDFLAAFLTYLIPGLGQVMQGRIGKGVLYFVCLYGLFFYGMWLGQFKNVWLADTSKLPPAQLPLVGKDVPRVVKDLSYRKEFLAQFWIGAAAWPAVIQYMNTPALPDNPADEGDWEQKAAEKRGVLGAYMQAPSEGKLNELQRNADTTWDLGWVLTVIAGVLNVLVIFDALAGPLVKEDMNPDGTPKAGGGK